MKITKELLNAIEDLEVGGWKFCYHADDGDIVFTKVISGATFVVDLKGDR